MDLKLGSVLPVWWSFLWRTAVYSVAVGFLIRIAAYLLGKSGAIDIQEAMTLATLVAAVCYIPLSLLAMQRALSRHAPPKNS